MSDENINIEEKINCATIDNLSDQDLALLVKCSDYGGYLTFLRQNSNKRPFSLYAGQLGRFKSDSEIVKKNLPKIAVKLYHNHDPRTVFYFENSFSSCLDDFKDAAEKVLGKEVTVPELQNMFVGTCEQIIEKLYEANKDIALDLFVLGFKMYGVVPDEVLVSVAKSFIDSKEEKLEANEEKTEVENTTKKKTKKKSAANKEELSGNDEIVKDEKETVSLEKEIQKQDTTTITNNTKENKHEKSEEKITIDEMVNEVANTLKGFVRPKKKVNQADDSKINENNEPKLENEKSDLDDKKQEIQTSNTDKTVEIVKQEPNPVKKKNKEKPMKPNIKAIVGYIDIRSSFYNFNPIGEIDGNVYIPFKSNDLDALLPQSQNRNINLFYNPWDSDQVKFMNEHFYQDQTMLFYLNLDNLEENRDKNTGNLIPTGYKTPAKEVFRSGKMKQMYSEGLYLLKNRDILIDDIESQKSVRIDYDNILEGDRILISLKDGFYAGPYEVKHSSINNTYFIRPQVQENKYYISGYNPLNCGRILIEQDADADYSLYYPTYFYYILDDEDQEYKDIISDEILFSSFKDLLDKKNSEVSDFEHALDIFHESSLVGEGIPEDIRQSRIKRLEEILRSDSDVNRAISIASDVLSGIILGDDEEKASAIINKIIEDRPDFLDKIQSLKVIRDRIEPLKKELNDLELKKSGMSEEIESRAELIQKEISEKTASAEAELKKRQAELDEIEEQLEQSSNGLKRKDYLKDLERKVNYLEDHKQNLENDTRNLEGKFIELVNRYSDKMVDLSFDGFISSKMLQAAAKWEQSINNKVYDDIVEQYNSMELEELSVEQTVDYLVDKIMTVRPQYDRNTIINILVCTFQGFLTVFSGAPGCGKTSICNIVAKVMGLEKFNERFSSDDINLNRYIPVSVEHGWTSKRDFIGYYNPLTKTFEESNREVFDGLKLLDLEVKNSKSRFPYIILLDEANLSPIEYYWADFMNVCDDINKNSKINLGNDNVLSIPETLHFVATINNDDTTTTLSPRLVDRAWVITLPKMENPIIGDELSEDDIKFVTWDKLKSAFVQISDNELSYDDKIQKIYDSLKAIIKKGGMAVSPRVEIAMRKYWNVASRLMEYDEYNQIQKETVAFDYSVAQKILPKISGTGDEYSDWLQSFKSFCRINDLKQCEDILAGIIEKGDRNFKYYQFF